MGNSFEGKPQIFVDKKEPIKEEQRKAPDGRILLIREDKSTGKIHREAVLTQRTFANRRASELNSEDSNSVYTLWDDKGNQIEIVPKDQLPPEDSGDEE